jgi:glycine dehydrogenase subunit 2
MNETPALKGAEPSLRTGFHQAAWSEPLVMTLGRRGRRGVIPPGITGPLGSSLPVAIERIPSALRRGADPDLPEMSQPEVVRHFTRLSQMVLAGNVSVSLGLGTTTMKYNPIVHELVTRSPKLAELHPAQDDETTQGALEIIYRMGEYLEAISGMDRFSLQPGGGSQGIFSNAKVLKAYHASRGDTHRDEVITTIFSHPANGAAPATAGFKVITLYPGPRGVPDVDALKAAVSERTAGLFITNPEDTGIFNPHIDAFVKVIHDAGGLCVYDQANANGILGITRARDAGFDMCHFNLHKTFSVPHGCMGGAVGGVGVIETLAPFLPTPSVEHDGNRYFVRMSGRESIGTLRAWFGNVHSILKAYAWITMMGANGVRAAAEAAVLNNNYLVKQVTSIPGASIAFGETNDDRRLDQARYSWERLTEDTGVTTSQIHDRVIDFGVQSYFTSHHPWLVPEPFSLEPAESYSLEDLDEYAAVLRHIAAEAHDDPEVIRTAPHHSTTAPVLAASYEDPYMTWQAYANRDANRPSTDPTTG